MNPRSLFVFPALLIGCSEYTLNKAKQIEDGPVLSEEAPEIISETETDSGPDEDETELETTPEETLAQYDVVLGLSADDQWEGWVDGVRIDSQEGWIQANEYSFTLGNGPHVIAIRVDDLHQIINGFIAAVDIDGQPWSLSGDELWRVSAIEPSADWIDADFFDDDWAIPTICSDDAPWSGMPNLVDPDAEWIWHDADCRQALGTAWFRLSFELP